MKKFKVQTLIFLHYKKKKNDHRIFHLSTKLIARDSDEGFKPLYQNIMKKINNYTCVD